MSLQYRYQRAVCKAGTAVCVVGRVVMHLLFLLPLVSPRARARFPIAVTDDIVWCIGGHS